MIEEAFRKGPVFIAYLTAGDGGIEYSLESALALIEGGVDILEIGIPYHNPIADGPTIQQAMKRSLERDTTPRKVLELVRKIREKSSAPLILFSYAAPLLDMGKDYLFEAYAAGINGLLAVDLPFEELDKVSVCSEMDQILVISPSTSEEMRIKIGKRGQGFIYYACQKGVTGIRTMLPTDFSEEVQKIKNYTNLPIAVGFGISKKEMAAEVLKYAQGFIVGSFFVEAMGRSVQPEELSVMAKNMDPR